MMMKSHRFFFSLIELLIVLSTFIILFTLLQPSLQKIISESRGLQCKKNLMTISAALSFYTSDHADIFPPYYGLGRRVGTEGHWQYVMANDYLKEKSRKKYYVSEVIQKSFLFCPSDTVKNQKSNRFVRNMAINGDALFNNHHQRWERLKGITLRPIHSIRKPHEVMAVGDGNSSETSSEWGDSSRFYHSQTHQRSLLKHARHGDRDSLNFTFADGHVETWFYEDVYIELSNTRNSFFDWGNLH